MQHILKTSFILVAAFWFSGCTIMTSHMTPVLESQKELKPQPDKALVVFMRPSIFGGAIQSTIYDDQKYIGTVSANTKVAYQATPGEHLFMVIGESADFMRATLKAGYTYYARVAARMGLWKARFSFIPYNGEESEDTLQEWLKDTKLVKVNSAGLNWAVANRSSITSKHDEYLQDWNSKAEEDKQTLHTSSGRK